MNGKELMESMGYVDEKYIAEAEDTAPKRRVRWRPLAATASAAACLALLELFQVISGVIIQLGPLPALLSVALREWLLSLCWTPLIYLIFYRIYRRVGGQKLA